MLQQGSHFAGPLLYRFMCNRFLIVDKAQPESCTGLGKQKDWIVCVDGSYEILQSNCCSKAPRSLTHKVVLKDDEAIEHAMPPRHLTATLNLKQRSKLIITQLQQLTMQLPEERAHCGVIINRDAYRQVVN